MAGVSTESLKALSSRFRKRYAADANLTMSQELFGAASALDHNGALRRGLTDPSRDASQRSKIASAVFEGKVYPSVREIVSEAAGSRWSAERDLADALEHLGVMAAAATAYARGGNDAVREVASDLLAFTQVVQDNAEVQRALTDPRAEDAAKATLAEKVAPARTPEGRSLVKQAVEGSRGMLPADLAEKFATILSDLLNRSIAKVTVSSPLDPERQRRLEKVVAGLYGKDVTLDVTVDPSILGGMKVQVGDEIIDGSMAAKISELDRSVAAS